MAWTDIDRLQLKDALDAAHLNKIKGNIDSLLTSLLIGHRYARYHDKAVDGTTTKGSYPCLILWVSFDGTDTYTADQYPAGADVGAPSRSGAGRVSIDIEIDTAFGVESVDDMCVVVKPYTTVDRKNTLESYDAQCYASIASTTLTLDIAIHKIAGTVSDTPTLADCGFGVIIAGKQSAAWTAANDVSSLASGVPDIIDGMPVLVEHFAALRTALISAETYYYTGHNGFDGSHARGRYLPAISAVCTYRAAADSDESRDWVTEPYSSGLDADSIERVDTTYNDGSDDKTGAILGMKHACPYAALDDYIVLSTPNPWAHENGRARLAHCMQYKDSAAISMRYYDGAAWSWADADADGTGAPDSLAILAFQQVFDPAAFSGTDSMSRFAAFAAPASGDKVSLRLLTHIRDNLIRFRQIFLTEHTTNGYHRIKPPGILGVGRVTWSGAAYTLEDFSYGVASVSTLSSPNGCQLTFPDSFSSRRNYGIILCADQGTGTIDADAYAFCQCVRSSVSSAQVFTYSGSSPTAAHMTFSYVLIGSL